MNKKNILEVALSSALSILLNLLIIKTYEKIDQEKLILTLNSLYYAAIIMPIINFRSDIDGILHNDRKKILKILYYLNLLTLVLIPLINFAFKYTEIIAISIALLLQSMLQLMAIRKNSKIIYVSKLSMIPVTLIMLESKSLITSSLAIGIHNFLISVIIWHGMRYWQSEIRRYNNKKWIAVSMALEPLIIGAPSLMFQKLSNEIVLDLHKFLRFIHAPILFLPGVVSQIKLATGSDKEKISETIIELAFFIAVLIFFSTIAIMFNELHLSNLKIIIVMSLVTALMAVVGSRVYLLTNNGKEMFRAITCIISITMLVIIYLMQSISDVNKLITFNIIIVMYHFAIWYKIWKI